MNKRGFGLSTIIIVIAVAVVLGGFAYDNGTFLSPMDFFSQGSGSCTDSDGGQNFFEQGETCGGINTGETNCIIDTCTNPSTLKEYYCNKNQRAQTSEECEFGCFNGACLEAQPTCGNSVFEFGEECEDCNTRSGDKCSSNCAFEYCGDGVRQVGSFVNEVCDGSDGCLPSEVCDPEFCNACYSAPLGEDPVVTITASPPEIHGQGNVTFTITAYDPDSLLVSHKMCDIISDFVSCIGGGGGEGCTNEEPINPASSTHSRTFTEHFVANPNVLSQTQVRKVIYTDQNGNRGYDSVVIPIYNN